ncbi:Meiotic expression up-regulated protein 26 like [Verticillium longisporum]|uniref:Meiotic expression up-regulated protein 26 like n=1 Tax=Verticillium longisporum TaxID=100787 RepID=A0A8I2ZRA7_VERLO|nr:Meiotic expression up-regulated protein 26 like [Verticillium longisporum]
MNGSELPVTSEAMSQSNGMWTTPVSHGMRPRPATIHEGFSFPVGEDFGALSPWDSSALPFQTTPNGVISRPGSVHQQQDFYHATCNPMDHGWHQKPCPDSYDIEGLDPSLTIGQAFTTDEAIPVLDLRFANHAKDGEPLTFDNGPHPRRMSGSSFTMSTSGALSDMPSYDDFSAALSEAPSFSSDYPPLSNRNSLMSSTQLSPVASPRMTPQSRTELVRTQSRGRASPSPRPGVRSAPYSVDRPQNKRWSTGTYGTTPQRRPSPFVYHPGHDAFGAHQRLPSRNGSPTIQHQHVPLSFNNLQAAQQHPFLIPGPPQYPQSNMFLPSQVPSQGFHPEPQRFEQPPPLMSHGLFRMLSSNADPHALHGHYADLSDPPDLYAALHEEQIPPPPEDMNPSDPDLVPHEQELRFEGDLYTPRWVRGHGNKREGWCGICKPGRWLVLKNSAFWYDKSFTHGISAATGSPFQEPHETRRMDGNPDVWEGLCGSCNEWIALVSSKKKGTTWFRHAYKCHTHPKIKDGPKRTSPYHPTNDTGGSLHHQHADAGTNVSTRALPSSPTAHAAPAADEFAFRERGDSQVYRASSSEQGGGKDGTRIPRNGWAMRTKGAQAPGR